MPVLADIYSAADAFKRNLKDFVQNPGPHVTIETDPNLIDMGEYTGNYTQGTMNQEEAIAAVQALQKDPTVRLGDLSHWIDEIKSKGLGIPSILQIKGPNNASPDPKYFPLIQDFIKRGRWSDIQDIEHTGLSNEEINKLLGY